MIKTPHSLAKRNVVHFYLLKIITKVIIKAIAMIDTAINPKKNRLSKFINIMYIAPPPFSQ